jgi:hypothetical protein
MRKFILLLFLSSAFWAQTCYMNVNTKSGTISYSIASIQKLTFDGIVDGVDGDKLKNALKTFSLLQNYPNPFNPSTSINYKVPSNKLVNIKIYDSVGKLV